MTGCYFVIPAGGRGVRFGGEMPKQFSLVAGLPILFHTLTAIAPFALDIIIALPEEYHDYWSSLCTKYDLRISHKVVKGGATRFQSVRSALEHIPPNGLVAVHDAVRPLVSSATIQSLIDAATRSGAAIPFLPITDSIRYFSERESKTLDRTTIVSVQTPQIFHTERLQKAYSLEEQVSYTDDASVYETYYHQAPLLVRGNEENIKITHPTDALLLELFLSHQRGDNHLL